MSEPITFWSNGGYVHGKREASLAATAGSAAPDLWLEYLRSEHPGEYDGLCKCVGCQNIRAGFEKWKWEREQVQPNNRI